MTDAFGVVALVALTPLIAIQLMGVVYKLKTGKRASMERAQIADDCDAIVDLEEVE
ncbi:putative membrane protein [Firmicutes bacterium CAG:555]|nr:putative membrane protein [Firmicutes bacterium CAG:555]